MSNKVNHEKVIKTNEKLINLDELMISNNWSNNYYKTIKSLYNKIITFLKNKDGSEINDTTIDGQNKIKELMKNPINIEEFVFTTFNKKNTSFDNRASKVRRLIRWILNDYNWNFVNIQIHEKQNKTTRNIDKIDLNIIFQYLIKENNKTIYLIAIFCLILGLSLRIISKLKKKNILLNTFTLNVYENKNRIKRNLSGSLGHYLLSYLEDKKLEENEFLFFNDFFDKNYSSREKYIKMIISNCISKINFSNDNKLFIILKLMTTNRKHLISCDYVFESNKFFLMNADDINKLKNNNLLEKIDMTKNIRSCTNKDKSFLHNKFTKDSFQFSININNDLSSKSDFKLFSDDEYSFTDIKILKDNLICYNNKFSQKSLQFSELSKTESQMDSIETNYNFNYFPFYLDDKTDYTSNCIKVILKEFNLDFIDSLKSDNNNEYIPDLYKKKSLYNKLNGSNLYFYNEMKKNTINGFYCGLKLLKKKGKYVITTSCEIDENNLLFEVGGELVNKDFINDKRIFFSNKKFCYFYLFDEKKNANSKIILLSNKGNIAFFITKGDSSKTNVKFIPFVKPNNQICLLCISSKKIKKNKLIICNEILIV